MAIRKQEEFDEFNNKAIGKVNFGTNIIQANGTKFAKEVLVYMVTGVSESFKIPVAYFLIDGLKTNEKASAKLELKKLA